MADKYTRNLEYIAQNMGQDLLPYISVEEKLRGLTPDQRLEGLDAAQRLEGLDAAQRLEGLSLEDILDALSDDECRALRQLLDDQENNS